MKKGILITGGLVTAFLVSFSASAYFMMNAKDLVFAKDKQEVTQLNQQIDDKDMEIADLKEQVERYQTLYTAAVAGKKDSGDQPTKKPTATTSPTKAPASTNASTNTTKPTATVKPTEKPAATKAPTKEPDATKTPENTKKPAAPDETNTSANE